MMHSLALVGLFAFKRDTTPVEKWKPTLRDTAELRDALRNFEVQIINGKKQYPFEQYCADRGWISFMENGQIAVTNTEMWRRACDTYDLMKWENGKELEKLFAAYPEQEVEYESRLEVAKNEIRALFDKVNASV